MVLFCNKGPINQSPQIFVKVRFVDGFVPKLYGMMWLINLTIAMIAAIILQI